MPYWSDKVAIVTGGSAGLGLAIARALAAAGAKVVLAARDQSRLDAAVAALSSGNQHVFGIACDVTRQDDVARLVDETIGRFGRLDLLVNNAGRSMRGEVLATAPEQFAELLDVNFVSLVRCTQAAMPHLIASRGHVVNIGSLASKGASRYLGAYPASKFPVAAFSQQLRLELGPRGVHTLLVCPGPIRRDDAGDRYREQSEHLPEEARKPGGGVKVGRIDPDDLARRILRACERRQAELVVPGRARILFAIAQLWPSLGDWLVTRFTSK